MLTGLLYTRSQVRTVKRIVLAAINSESGIGGSRIIKLMWRTFGWTIAYYWVDRLINQSGTAGILVSFIYLEGTFFVRKFKEAINMDFKQQVVTALTGVLGDSLPAEKIAQLIETPKTSDLGDYAFPTFILAKTLRKAPQQIAQDLVDQMDVAGFEKVIANGPYINFFLDKAAFSDQILKTVLTEAAKYGESDLGHGGNVPIDMSSPNIAKPISMGHLRSTVIGNSIAKILTKVGFNPIKINHLGDWGTQFGKLIVAYKKWGSEEEVKKDPITNLLKYYVKFHQEDVELNDYNFPSNFSAYSILSKGSHRINRTSSRWVEHSKFNFNRCRHNHNFLGNFLSYPNVGFSDCCVTISYLYQPAYFTVGWLLDCPDIHVFLHCRW